MAFTREDIFFITLNILKNSLQPFKIGLRRKALYERLLIIHDHYFQRMSHDNEKAFNMRFQRVLDNLIDEGILIRDSKGHKNTFYRLDKKGYIHFFDESGILAKTGSLKTKEEFEKFLDRQILRKSNYLRLPPYQMLIGGKDIQAVKDMGYETFQDKMIEEAISILEPQILLMWDWVNGLEAHAKLVSAFRRTSA